MLARFSAEGRAMSTSMMPLASMIGSALTALWTAYFWLVRVKRERPDLRAHLADHETFLAHSTGENRHVGVKFGLIVANYSALPNALLGVRLWLRQKDRGWLEVENVSFDAQTPLPFNVPAMQTVLVRVAGRVGFPTEDDFEGTPAVVASYLDRYLAGRREIGVELRGLGEYVATAELVLN
jgi:hypothetical protein